MIFENITISDNELHMIKSAFTYAQMGMKLLADEYNSKKNASKYLEKAYMYQEFLETFLEKFNKTT